MLSITALFSTLFAPPAPAAEPIMTPEAARELLIEEVELHVPKHANGYPIREFRAATATRLYAVAWNTQTGTVEVYDLEEHEYVFRSGGHPVYSPDIFTPGQWSDELFGVI